MPYVKEDRKSELGWGEQLPDNAGDMNYMITVLCDEYLQRKGLKYEHINAIIGVLECAKLEMYRRLAAPYENQKILENGDVYDVALVAQADPHGTVVTPVTHRDVRLSDFSGFDFGRIQADH